ncbi:MAG: hypothetical protein KKE42_08955 [Alphaproteobacteria bacterium]|uniref:hypothetical protein n=1 Tax=Brevundimonas sp. TaxID=1871086 RepID=UPI0017C83233|nr:hypothetical protein [Brevundimonas sp.]MBA3050041.1 hypothetical protein [Brevundimonas sp.]MBU3971542.1 hypothetical protein [Alphaproteobacteria bacterium]MBU3973911.1 hypothetical protein [Alphaproteobacteria bacterium]MBU4136892.1 hypothetical protein [Alphaproteobacteria bacterium]
MNENLTPRELAEAFGLVSSAIDGHRAHNGRDDALAMALLSAGATLLLPKWGVERVGDAAAKIVRDNALALAQTGAAH